MCETAHLPSRSGRSSWRFAYLLAALLLLIAIHPFFVGSVWESLLLDSFFSLVVLTSVFAVSPATTTRVVVFVLAVPVLGSRWLVYLLPVEAVTAFGLVAGAAFVAFVVVRILLYVLRQTTVTSDTVFAALCVYLLFGLCWGLVFALIEQQSPGSFRFPTTEVGTDLLRELLYFSLVTLTTVGYGDTTPVTPVAQGFSNLEAVLGQIYLAVLVARLVGLQIAQGMSGQSSR